MEKEMEMSVRGGGGRAVEDLGEGEGRWAMSGVSGGDG